MSRAVAAELRKLLTTRLWWGMGLALFLSGALMALLIGSVSGTVNGGPPGMPRPTPAQTAIDTYTGGAGIGYTLTMVIGIMTMGAEYRHKTITGSLLAVPERTRLVLAKVLALLGLGAAYGLVFLLGSVTVGALTLSARGLPTMLGSGTVLRSILLVLLALGLWALIGLGLGVLVPNQVAAIMIGVGVTFVVEPLIGLFLGRTDWGAKIAEYLPGQVTSAMLSGTSNPNIDRVTWWVAALVLVTYAAVMAGAGTLLTRRRDIL